MKTLKTLVTFSGRFGDAIWSLPAVREIAKREGSVDFAMMSQYASLVPLLEAQSYIAKAFAINEWKLEGESAGCQPWKSPDFVGREQYVKVIDMTYRQHPHIRHLAEWIARDAKVRLREPLLPFLQADGVEWVLPTPVIAYGFNSLYHESKMEFLLSLREKLNDFTFVDTTKLPWLSAAALIKSALCFVGCRSSNYALAHGVGQNVIVFEPHPARTGWTFAWPYGTEFDATTVSPEDSAALAAGMIHVWQEGQGKWDSYHQHPENVTIGSQLSG